jgi:hypothetical protein
MTVTDVAAIEALVHYGPALFEVGNPGTLQTAAFVLRRESFKSTRENSQGIYFRLVKEPDVQTKRLVFEQTLEGLRRCETNCHVYTYRQGDFSDIPGSPWVYYVTPSLRKLFKLLPNLEKIADPRQGLATADNFRFLKFWWEVGQKRIAFGCANEDESSKRPEHWYPYMKGGGFLRWYGNQEYVINYGQNGHELKAWAAPLYGNSGWSRIIKSTEYYFRRGVTWTDLTVGRFSARLSPGGFIFDIKGSSAFPEDIPFVLGILNSSYANYALNLINPTVSYQVGDIGRLPIPSHTSNTLKTLVEKATNEAKAEGEEDETSYDFVCPAPWLDGVSRLTRRHDQLSQIESEIDEEVYRMYQISAEDREAIENELSEYTPPPEADNKLNDESGTKTGEPSSVTPEELSKRWVGYAAGVALGRFKPGPDGVLGSGRFDPEVSRKLSSSANPYEVMVLEDGHPDDLAARVFDILRTIYGDATAEKIIRTATNNHGPLRDILKEYLIGSFFREHVKRYRKRPVYWLLQSPQRHYNVYLFHERATDQTLALLQGKRYLGGRIHRVESELRGAKNKEAQTTGSGKNDWKKKSRDLLEELEDLKTFDRHISIANNFPITDARGNQKTVGWQPELDDGVLLNAAPLHELAPSWKRADNALDLREAWNELEKGEYNWAKTAMRYWPEQVLKACKDNKSLAIAHGLL